ncbi:MAG: aminopeptidase [Thermoanaerobaculia bacterium]
MALTTGLVLAGCYGGRTAWGGLRMMVKRQSVERLLADPGTDPELARRLRSARRLVEFAEEELALPVGRAYDSYVELGRLYATWTVSATPELSVEPQTWCFPIAGCVSYRGYFSEPRARRFAEHLAERRMDVEVGGVRAFSTLGWLRDPLLSSFVALPEPELAALLFHELAHRRLYVKGDTTFNESFASLVEEEGVRRWLGGGERDEELAAWLAARRHDGEIVDLALATRARLAEAFAEPRTDDWKRRRKAELLGGLRAAYRERRPDQGDRWDGFFDAGLNNARLASLGAYHELLPGLRRLLAAEGDDLERFYAAAAALADLSPEDRRSRLVAPAVPTP